MKSIYDEVNDLLEPIDLTLDLMKKLIQPTIFSGLKSNIESIKHTTKRHEERAKKEHDLLLLRTKQVYILVEALNKNEINQDDYILLIGKIYDTGISGSIDEELEALK